MAVCTGNTSPRREYPAIPDGWLDYSCFGGPIKGTQIIAIKTPLKKNFHNGLLKRDCPPVVPGEKYTGGIPQEEEFTPTQCLERVKTKFKGDGLELCAVIDLTFTNRYYNPQEFKAAGVQHHKIKCPGREIPSDGIYEEFSEVMTRFLAGMRPEGLLAVHCTHGLNRTGYLVCRYLVQQQKFDIETAIKEFNVARGYEIERENYLQDLRDGCLRDRCYPRELQSLMSVRLPPFSDNPDDRKYSGRQGHYSEKSRIDLGRDRHSDREDEDTCCYSSYSDHLHSLPSHYNHHDIEHGNYDEYGAVGNSREDYRQWYHDQSWKLHHQHDGLHGHNSSWEQGSLWSHQYTQEHGHYEHCRSYRSRLEHFGNKTWRPKR